MCRVNFDNDTKRAILVISNRHVLGAEETVVMNFHQREEDRQARLLGGVVPLFLPKNGSASVNVAVKHQGDVQCYGLNNRSYGFPQWRYPDQRLDCARALTRVIVNFEGRQHRSQAFVLENPDASVTNVTVRSQSLSI